MITHWIFLISGAAAFFLLGSTLGFLLVESAYRRGLIRLCQFSVRMVSKAFLRTFNMRHVRTLEKADGEHAGLSLGEKLQRADPSALEAARQFRGRLTEIYGEDLSAVYFFGSRLRGNHTSWSDVDMVVFFRPTISFSRARYEVKREVFRILLQHGLLIQPHLAYEQVLSSLDAESHPMIRRAVQTGISIQ